MKKPRTLAADGDDAPGDTVIDPALLDRINRAVEAVGGVAKAAVESSAAEQSLRQWMTGKRRPPLIPMSRLARAAEVSLDWLATGEEHSNAPRDSVVMLPRFDVTYAGEVTQIDGAEWPRVPVFAELLDHAGADPTHTIAMVADGREMEPTIREGALIAVDRSRANLLSAGVYVFIRDRRMMLLRAEPRFDGSVALSADGRPGDRDVVPADRISSLGVVGRVALALSEP